MVESPLAHRKLAYHYSQALPVTVIQYLHGEGVGPQPSELERGWRLADTVAAGPHRAALEPDYCTGQPGLRALW